MSVYKSSHRGPYFFQLVVEKIVHQDLAVVKDSHPGVERPRNNFRKQEMTFEA